MNNICNTCGKVFNTLAGLKSHLRSRHKAVKTENASKEILYPTIECPECGKTYKRGAGLGAHRKHVHNVAGSYNGPLGRPPGKYCLTVNHLLSLIQDEKKLDETTKDIDKNILVLQTQLDSLYTLKSLISVMRSNKVSNTQLELPEEVLAAL